MTLKEFNEKVSSFKEWKLGQLEYTSKYDDSDESGVDLPLEEHFVCTVEGRR